MCRSLKWPTVYNQAYAPVSQLAGRTFFRPDVVGQYTVLATITTTGSSGGTNIVPVTTNIIVTTVTAATYLGISACADCHSGGLVGVPSIYPTWTNTPHATFFTRAINGQVSSYYNKSCIVPCGSAMIPTPSPTMAALTTWRRC
jgi:hypothetical protein